METIGTRIRRLRKAQKMTQTELAERLKKALRTVQKYESDEIEITLSAAHDLAEALNTTAEYLMFGIKDNDDDEVSDELCADILNYLLEHTLSVSKIPVELRKAIDDYDKQTEQGCKCEAMLRRFETVRVIVDGYLEYSPYDLARRFNCSVNAVMDAISDMLHYDMLGYWFGVYHNFIEPSDLIKEKFLRESSREVVSAEDVKALREAFDGTFYIPSAEERKEQK